LSKRIVEVGSNGFTVKPDPADKITQHIQAPKAAPTIKDVYELLLEIAKNTK
jgi:hypothetical protein